MAMEILDLTADIADICLCSGDKFLQNISCSWRRTGPTGWILLCLIILWRNILNALDSQIILINTNKTKNRIKRNYIYIKSKIMLNKYLLKFS